MGEVQVGDYVFGSDGLPVRVSHVTAEQFNRECFEVKFSDGSMIVADGDHLWTVRDSRFGRVVTKTTCDLAISPTHGPRGERSYHIPIAPALQAEQRDLLIDPYVLGAWLGDGSSNGGGFTSADPEIPQRIRDAGYLVTQPRYNPYGLEFNIGGHGQSGRFRNTLGRFEARACLTTELRALDLIKNKHIPKSYLRASVAQRQALLEGLMDTDGHIEPNGSCEFSNTNRQLAEDALELVLSLGHRARMFTGRAKLDGRDTGACYWVAFTPTTNVFSLPRKAARFTGKNRLNKSRTLVSITPTPSVPVKCIQVEAPDYLYLAGRSLIATHNSVLGEDFDIAPALEGYPTGWFAPTYKILLPAWQEITRALRPIAAHISNQEHRIELITGGSIEFWSMNDDEAGRSRKYRRIVVDEAALVPKLQAAWQEAIRPTLTDFRGDAIFFSTPKGLNYFHTLYVWGMSDDHEGWESWQFPTLANTTIPELKDEVAEAKRDLAERVFRQEYLADFVELEGAVFRHINECVGAEEQTEAIPGHSYAFGVDWGKLNDFTVITVIDLNLRALVYMERFNQIDYSVQLPRLESLISRFHPTVIKPEQNSIGVPLIEKLMEKNYPVIPFVTTNSTKQVIIDGLALAFEREDIRIIDDPTLISELLSFEAERLPSSGQYRYSAPEGMHDDCLREGTLIKTATGYEPIEQIKPGDFVFTHEGRLRPVEKCIRKPFSGTMHRVHFGGQVPLDLSYNHPLLAAKRSFVGGKDGPFTRRDWVLPGDWKPGYRSVTPLITHQSEQTVLTEQDFYSHVKGSHPLLHEWKLDEEAARLVGRFLADGHARSINIGYSLEIAFHERDVEASERFAKYLEALGVSVRHEPMSGKCFKLIWSSKLMWHALRQCYDAKAEKRLPPWGYKLGTSLPLVLDEWLAGDGWRRKERDLVVGATTSRQLALEMRDIAISCGRASSIQHLRRSRYGVKNKDQFHVTIHDGWPTTACLRRVSEGECISVCRTNDTYEYEGNVYNLQVAEDRSFIAEGVVVHNCVMSLAMAWSCLDSEYAEDWGSVVWGLVTCGFCGRQYRDEPKGKACSFCGMRPPQENGNGNSPFVTVKYR